MSRTYRRTNSKKANKNYHYCHGEVSLYIDFKWSSPLKQIEYFIYVDKMYASREQWFYKMFYTFFGDCISIKGRFSKRAKANDSKILRQKLKRDTSIALVEMDYCDEEIYIPSQGVSKRNRKGANDLWVG